MSNRIWADVFDANGAKKGTVYDLLTVAVSKLLDGAGSVNVSFSAASDSTITLLTQECHIEIYIENDGYVRLFGKGVLRKRKASAASSSATITMTGPDSLDALTRRNALLGRIYTDEPIVNIASDLVSLVPGWSITVDDGLGNQTDRFDGVSVLKALIGLAQKKGLHLREGEDFNTLELGAFGSDSTLIALKPGTLTPEINYADDVLIIDSISQSIDTSSVVNWVIPLGGGEGTSQLTLANSDRTSPYTIHSLTGPDGRTLYYLQDDDSIELYGEIQGPPLLYKSINPVANSDTAKLLAANALYDAAAVDLQRMSVGQETYTVTAKKNKKVPRPGDKIQLIYKGIVPVTNDTSFTYIDVNDTFWILGVKESISAGGATLTLDISNVDRRPMDLGSQVGKVLEDMQVRNTTPQTTIFYYQDSSERVIMGGVSSAADKAAEWTLQIPDLMTDLIRVRFQFITRPPYSLTDSYWGPTGTPPYKKFYYVSNGTTVAAVYPTVLTMEFDGVDVTAALDPSGQWNRNGENAALDFTVDITEYILNASGGIFQTHTLVMKAGNYASNQDLKINTAYADELTTRCVGVIEGKFMVLGIGQAIVTS